VSAKGELDGLEPAAKVDETEIVRYPRSIGAGIRLNIRGRSVRLRRLSRSPTGLWRWLAILGPGLIATSAGNDAGGIATYSQAGAKYGYDLIWVMVFITIALSIVQEMSSRLGAASGRGLLDLVRERFGLGWALVAVAVILVANSGLIISEFVGIGAAAELFGLDRYVVVPIAGAFIWYLVVYGNYPSVEKIFLMMTLVFFAYPIAAFKAHPDWAAVAHGAVVQTVRRSADFLTLLVALIGTTISPYMQLFQQSSTVERRAARRRYGPERADAYVGAIFSDLMSVFMIVATAATLHLAGQTQIDTAADAARALEPVAGQAAKALFAIGLLGASSLAAAVLPLSTAYAISEAFGFPKGIDLDFRRARIFFGLFTVLTALGVGLAIVPGIPVIQLLVGVYVLNGALLPIVLVFILLLASDRRLMGGLVNTRLYNVLGWATFAITTTAIVLMLLSQLLENFGIHLLGGSSQ
jgi:Mn2+/Fe2+ NRAMP family transporter